MSTWVLHPQQIKFIHIPKNAGTAVTKWVDDNVGPVTQLDKTHTNLKDSNDIAPDTVDYFSFCVIRNTYDRLVSLYEFSEIKARKMIDKIHKKGKLSSLDFWTNRLKDYKKGFSRWLYTDSCLNEPNQLNYIFDVDGRQVSYIINYDTFDTQILEIKERLNISTDILPSNVRENKISYQNYYSSKVAKKVYDLYKTEIDYFEFTLD